MKFIRVLFILLVILALIYGPKFESHTIFNLGNNESKIVSGSDLIEGTTVDGFIIQDNKLYDIYSLAPQTNSIKDCKT